MGVLGIVAAFGVGTALGVSEDDIFAGFPGDLFVILVGVTFLFAIASNNGTVDWLHVPFQDEEFLPLKGVASCRSARWSTRAAARSRCRRRSTAARRPTGARSGARRRTAPGIFAIRQKRAKRSTKKRFPPSAALVSAAGAERPCQRASGPPKGIRVRSLVTTAKGVFRTVGARRDRRARQGQHADVHHHRPLRRHADRGRPRPRGGDRRKKSGKRRTVRPGRAYLVRAQLFRIKKGRRDS